MEIEIGKQTVGGIENVPGYYCKLRYGVAGKISSNEKVYIKPNYPFEMYIIEDNQTKATIEINDLVNYKDYSTGHNGSCKTQWTSTEIGSCDYDGRTVSNCEYT